MRRSSFELNDKEKKVLAAFPREVGAFVEIEELARRCFSSVGIAPDKKGNSWVRNSLRKLLRLKLVKHKGAKAGEYARTDLRPSDVLNNAVDKGLCPGPKVGTKPQDDEGDKKPAKAKKPKKAKKAEKSEKAEEETAESEEAESADEA